MAKLIINPTSGAKKEIPVAGRVLSIGRDPSNDLVLSDAMVSRRHAILEVRGEEFVLRDNNSSNGTLVNGDRVVSEQGLRDGDLIAIGSCRLLFQADIASPPATTPLATAPPAAPASTSAVPVHAGRACPACGSEATPPDRFCRQCGKEIPAAIRLQQVLCAGCGATIVLPANFCSACGKVLLKEEQRHQPTAPQQRGQTPPHPEPAAPAMRVASREGGRNSGSQPTPIPSARGPAGREGLSERKAELPPPAARGGPIPAAPALRPSVAPLRAAAARADSKAAGFWIRLAACLIDSIIVGLPMLLASAVGGLLLLRQGAPGPGAELDPSRFTPGLVFLVTGGFLTFILSIAYPLYFWGARGATPGKKLFGLTVVTTSGQSPIGFGPALVRLAGYLLSGLLFGIGFLLIAFSEDKRGLHDRLAETRVVRRR